MTKRIIKLGEGKFVHLDSYGEFNDNTIVNALGPIVVIVLGIGIATITVAALFGVNLLSPPSPHPLPSSLQIQYKD